MISHVQEKRTRIIIKEDEVSALLLSCFSGPSSLLCNMKIEEDFCMAAKGGHVEEVRSLLRDHPTLNPNWRNQDRWTPLHFACLYGRLEVVKLLLAHPAVNVNPPFCDETPFSLCCQFGHASVVHFMLENPQVDISLPDQDGHTPLWIASRNGHREVIERLIASGRDLGDFNVKPNCALEIAREFKRTEVAALLERFTVNPAQTRHELRVKLGILDALAAEVFALTVFLCDDLLQLRPAFTSSPAARFFIIVNILPMELQMILCHRAIGSMKQNIPRKNSEAAFRSLDTLLLSSSS